MTTVDIETTNICAHVILVDQDGKIMLQQRDNNPGILNPGLIAPFGGSLHKGETLAEGLRRELQEELEIDVTQYECYEQRTYYKTEEFDGVNSELHIYVLKEVDINLLILHEGTGIFHDTVENALKSNKLTRICRLALEDYQKANDLA